MGRVATILRVARDAWGDDWDIGSERPTSHGFSVCLGWPHGEPRGRGSGGPRVVVTPEIAAHLEAYRTEGGARGGAILDLPIGATAIKRIRRLLGHHYIADRAAWWEERVGDLADLTISEFAERHGCSIGGVAQARAALLGPTLRPAGWWRAPDVAAALLADRPRAEIADDLGLSVGSVGRLRWILGHDARTMETC